MKNPLNKRLPRELKSDIGKYIVIFVFLVATIGLVSGFLVAGTSMKTAFDESFDKNNIEDGYFVLDSKITDDLSKKLEDEDLKLYENFYKEETCKDATYRIYKNRSDVDKIELFDGEFPKNDNEIVLDRLFSENNSIEIGDKVTFDGKDYNVSGYVAFSDYTALFKNNADMMFDAQNFTVATVTDNAFKEISDKHLNYCYSFIFNDTSLSEQEKHDKCNDIKELIAKNAVMNNFVAEPDNQAIHFSGDDIGSDTSMMITLLYIVIAIMAFVFAVTTSNTIEKESAVIGTLRASGYTRGELLRHYLLLPVVVTLIGAVLGNILGYTVFKDVIAEIYYGSYSLGPYVTLWNGYAFVITTVVPCIIMVVVNIFILSKKLSLSPLKFLRRDLSKKEKKKVAKLPDFSFMTRFRLRVIFQNKSSYIVLFVGILFSNLILMFSLMLPPLLDNFKAEVIDNMICDYQYILKVPAETKTEGAEKYAVTTLETDFENSDTADEITVFGVDKDSKYVDAGFVDRNSIYVSEGVLEKFGLKVGDNLNLKTKYDDNTYRFTISGTYKYPASLAVFMDIENFRNEFDKPDNYFSGYFSDKEITDIEDDYIASEITQKDLTVISDQMTDSMGGMFPLVTAFSVLLYMMLVYLLSKIIIEKNANSVSIVKILGYQNGEITRLYILSTAIVAILSVIISLPVCYLLMKWIYGVLISSFSGWLTFYIEPMVYVKMLFFGIVAYAVVGALQFLKIKKIPMEEALKNAE
ncbi:ABC transporter permease [Ruminococcus sp.]|uniref:ABC transporter permease n=1 Tax=Ruminococcus sp. TaxID=41978 RepID=UPI0038698391